MPPSFAFEVWYMLFGLTLLKDYFKKHYLKKEFYPSQWGLICPFVAFSVLGSFFYKMFVANYFTLGIIALAGSAAIALYLVNLVKQFRCARSSRQVPGHNCANGYLQTQN